MKCWAGLPRAPSRGSAAHGGRDGLCRGFDGFRGSPSTMTRSTGSVPEGRSSTALAHRAFRRGLGAGDGHGISSQIRAARRR